MNRPWIEKYDAHVPADVEFPAISIPDQFKLAAEKYSDQIFIDFEDSLFTYDEIYKLAIHLSVNLKAIGLKAGDRVGLMLPNIPQFVVCYYAILMAGGIVTAINPAYTFNEVEALILQAGTRFLVCMEDRAEELSALNVSGGVEELIITQKTGFQKFHKPSKFILKNSQKLQLLDLLKTTQGIENENMARINPLDPAIFQFSGGTTGAPKPAMGSHRNIIANIHQFSAWCNLQELGEVILTAIPLYHVYGMVLGMNIALTVGAKVVLIANPSDTESLLQKIEEKEVTFFPGVPTMYHAINTNEDVLIKKYKLDSIEACISGSFTLHASIKEKFESITGGSLMEGYGLSEAPTATHCNPLRGKNKTGSIGLPLPGVNAKIVDEEDHTVEKPVGEIGELAIRGPQVMLGYHDQPAATADTIKDGWLLTGDIAYMDEEGYFFLVDRKKALIKVNGLQVWPNEVENVLNSHPGVRESAVAGVEDVVHGEKVIAWVVTNSGADLNQEKLRELCRNSLAAYKVPSEILFVDSVPRSGVGKVLRRILVSEYPGNKTKKG